MVPITEACTSCGNTAPRLVGTGLAIPAAVGPTITIAPPKSFGKLVSDTEFDCWLQSIHIRPNESVATGPNLGMRIFSTPYSFSLTWNVLSPAATRKVSKLKLG